MKYLRSLMILWGGLAVAPGAGASGSEIAFTDKNGSVRALRLSDDQVDIRTDLRLPKPGWKDAQGMERAKDVKVSSDGARQTWSGRIEIEQGKSCRYDQTLEETDRAAKLSLKVTAEEAVELEGVYLWLDFSIADFSGGKCQLAPGKGKSVSATLPKQQPKSRHLLSSKAVRASFADAAGNVKLDMSFDRACPVTVQDNREYKGKTYSAFIEMAHGSLAKDQSTSLTIMLKATGEPDRTPARLTLDANKARYHFDGFGGNYCFAIESPVTQYTLANLRVGWARTEMTLDEWEPKNQRGPAGELNWPYLESQDKPGSDLRREFELHRQIQRRGIPYVISAWHAPDWVYETTGTARWTNKKRINADQWPALVDSIGSYLQYAKRQYGVEPDFFSFNEPNIGVMILLTAEEHRDAIKRIGARLTSLGLKTRMLLGDVSGPRDTQAYCEPAANDPEAMRYVGAVAFHSWGGAEPKQYEAWGDLAERLKLPLLVAELGVDASAHRNKSYDSFDYAIKEARMYQELILYARPQGTMQWEFTADYSLVKVNKKAPVPAEQAATQTAAQVTTQAKSPTTSQSTSQTTSQTVEQAVELIPTTRFFIVKHFCDLTPPHSAVLTTSSDNSKTLFTAFAGEMDGRRVVTLHVLNTGAARPASIRGLPRDVKTLRAVCTSETESFAELPPVSVKNGAISLKLAPHSLLTLSNAE